VSGALSTVLEKPKESLIQKGCTYNNNKFILRADAKFFFEAKSKRGGEVDNDTKFVMTMIICSFLGCLKG
jgi:hypothetical protein